MLKVIINEPYWSAGQKFGWGVRCYGVGIKKDILFDAKRAGEKIDLTIKSRKERFILDPEKAIEFAQKTRSKCFAGRNTILYVVPKTMFDDFPLDK